MSMEPFSPTAQHPAVAGPGCAVDIADRVYFNLMQEIIFGERPDRGGMQACKPCPSYNIHII